MIDIHTHIIFDIDDGAEDFDVSLSLCRQAYSNGFSGIIATPHFTDFRNIDSFILERDSKLNAIQNQLKIENIDITLYTGAELYLSKAIYSAADLDCLTLNNSRYILCEFPLGRFDVEQGLDEFEELLRRGYTPILAHPERYFEVHRDPRLLDRLLRRGALFQINADSLAGNLDSVSQQIATDLLLNGDAQFIASDAHDETYRNMDYRKKFSTVSSEITQEMLVRCLKNNPESVIRNSDITE